MYKIIKQEKIEGSEILIQLTIQSDAINKNREHAIKHLNEHADIDGFRKGHIPENVLIKKFGEMTILEEAVEITLKEIYPKVLEETKIDPISYPKITITKIAKDTDVEVDIKIPVMPSFTLPDYKEIAKKENKKQEEINVTEKEVEDIINEIKKSRNHDGDMDEKFIKSLGDFKDENDLREKIKENVLQEKTYKTKQKKRLEILDAIAKKTKIEVPEVLIELELDRMVNEFSNEIQKIGSSLDKYLKEINKTIEDVKKDWIEKAKERVVNEFILKEICVTEKIKPDEAKINEEVEHLKEHHPDTEESKIRAFMEDVLTKEEVFKFLEEQK